MSDRIAWSVIWPRAIRHFAVAPLLAVVLLAGCSDSDNGSKGSNPGEIPDYINAPASGPVATIRRGTASVPYILADNLESASFGAGYAQAQDAVCLIADGIVKARGERAKYFGPGPGNIHVINDFSYKAQHIWTGAASDYRALSPAGQAMLKGFVAGYNKYVRETSKANFPGECRNAPWVFEITTQDLLAYYRIVAGYGSGAAFATGAIFLAVPPGVDPNPTPVLASATPVPVLKTLDDTVRLARENTARQDFRDIGLASNAWGIGLDLAENGRGVLLANPHFPYTGTRRFYEMQFTVPGLVNVHGAGLIGTPLPLLSFNERLGWSHTVSTARHFTLYELRLKSGDNLKYIKDGVEKPITSETFTIQVNTGGPTPLTLSKTFYYSEYGPMVAFDAMTGGSAPAWGGTGSAGVPAAFTYRDANASAVGMFETFLGMAQATNLERFKDVFRNCGSTMWVNTIYADDQGNAFYIDSTSVPNLSPTAIGVLNAKLALSATYKTLFDNGLTVLDGSTSQDDWVEGDCRGRVPFEGRPMLARRDFVQNSNDSYWATNPAAPLEGYSPLFGAERTAQGPRTRLGLYMLQNPTKPGYAAQAPAGQDGRFSAADIARVLHNNRSWYAEQFLPDLRSRCDLIGANPVNLPGGGSRSVAAGCAVLKSWSGVYDHTSVGAHVYRVFIADYLGKTGTHLIKRFDPADPVGTPSTPAPPNTANLANDPMLVSLASGLSRLDLASIPYNAVFGTVQTFQPTGGAYPGGTAVALGPSFRWHGGNGSIDGVFNAVQTSSSNVQEDTRYPRITTPTIPTTAGLSTTPGLGWQIAYGTSWHFGIEFNATGPKAFGLVSYSQSSNPSSPFFNDQMQRYSDKNMRAIPFSESEIAADLLPNGTITIRN